MAELDMIDRIIAREGGAKMTDDPDDPGGLTKYGITQRDHPQIDVRNLTYDEAKDVYIKEYYLNYNIHLLPQELQEYVLDFGVHSGCDTSVKYLQKLLGLTQDGVIGPNTLKTLQQNNLTALIKAYTRERALFLCRQVVNKPIKAKYLVGWITRVLSL